MASGRALYPVQQKLQFFGPQAATHPLPHRPAETAGYALTDKGTRTALLFVLFHQRPFGPLAHSQFVNRSGPDPSAESKLERAYRRTDAAIDHLVDLLRAA